MRARVLGEVRIDSGSGERLLPEGRVGALLGWLLATPGTTHPHHRIIELLWPDGAIEDEQRARARLHLVVNRLRQLLSSDGGGGLHLVTENGGYRLEADADSLDSVAFEEMAARARKGDDAALAEALALWRGEPYRGIPATEEVQRASERLRSIRRELEQARDTGSALWALRDSFARTKFIRPPVDGPDIVARRRLQELTGKIGDASVITISAPGGFGKSVLLSQWAEAQSEPVGWVNLESSDSDPVRFWSAIFQALAHADGLDMSAMPEATPGSSMFLEGLVATLAAAESPVGLVLDDFHRLQNPSLVDRLRAYFFELPPWITVAMATRDGVDTERLAGGGGLRHVRADDLRFEVDEIAELGRSAGSPLTADEVANMAEVTDGWPVAVAHMRRAGIRVADPPSIVRDIDVYIVDEVLREVPERIRRFLLDTSIIDHLNAGLCDAIRYSAESADHIQWLLERDLFLVSARADTGWYQYHSLVGEALRRRARTEPSIDEGQLLFRAAEWCRSHGFQEEALEYAIRAGDDATVSALVGDVVWARAMRGEAFSVATLIRSLDPGAVATDRRAHDVVMFFVAAWLDPHVGRQWVDSRDLFADDGDLMGSFVRSHQLQVRGCPSQAMELNGNIQANVDRYFRRHPNRSGFRELVTGTLELATVCCQVMVGDIHYDDGVMDATVEAVRQYGPLGVAWMLGEWAFLAYVQGGHDLAGRLLEDLDEVLALLDPDSIELGATRGLATRALVDSDRLEGDPSGQRRIARRLERLVPVYERLGWHTDAIPILLALYVTCHRAGDLEAASGHAAHADLLLGSCEEVPMLVQARNLLHTRMVLSQPRHDRDDLGLLTDRQETVLHHLAAGLTYKEIAAEVGITLSAVRSAVRAIYKRLGVHSRNEATAVLGLK